MKAKTTILKRQHFNPGFPGIFLNPFYFARKGLYENIKRMSAHLSGRLLDLGCGQKPYRELFRVTEYVGLEFDTEANRQFKAADCFYDGKRIPFENESFDAVFSSQVFEHIFNPDDILEEIYRVLKPKGKLLLTVPFVWDEHEQPIDYARYSSFGIRHLVEKHRFHCVLQTRTVSNFALVFQLINAYLYKMIPSYGFVSKLALVPAFSVFNMLGVLSKAVLPENKDLFLDNILLAEKQSEGTQQGAP